MASDSEVIREFLVSIGLKVDEATLSKFNGFMAGTAKTVFIFASALTAAAVGIETFVTTVADKMEDLYWSSQRLHDSVANIQDYALGIENLGGSAEAAKASLENVMQLLRTNPGYGGLLSALGVDPRQGATGIMEGLRQRFKTMPYFLAAQYAGRLGIDEATLWSMMHAKGPITGPGAGSGAFGATYKALGLDPQKAAKAAHDFLVQIRALEAEFTVIAQAMAYDLLPVAKRFTLWITQFLKGVAIPWLKSLTPEKVQGWINQFDAILVKLGAIADGLYNLLAFLGVIPSAPKKKDAYDIAQDREKQRAVAQDKKVMDWLGKTFGPIVNRISDYAQSHGFIVSATPSANNPGNIRPPGGAGFQMFPTLDAGIQAMAAQLRRDVSKHGLHSLNQIFGDPKWGWAPASDHNNPNAYARSVGKAVGVDPNAPITLERLNAILPAMIVAMSKVEGVRKDLTIPRVGRALAADYAKHVEIHQKTDIHVHGTGSPHAVGKEIAGHQSRVNGDLIRNLKPALQ